MNSTYLTHRGDIQSIASDGTTLGFVTNHPEGPPGSFYRLDPDKAALTDIALPEGARTLLADGSDFWMIGGDGQLLHATAKAKAVTPVTTGFEPAVFALVALSSDRLGMLAKESLGIIDRNSGTVLQSIDLNAKATAIAADPTGQWIAVGSKDGSVTVFECEGKEEFQFSETEKLHEGQITALLFEPEELRFLSAATDGKILLTHARGKLEPEDRGRDHGHEDRVTAMVLAPGDRFISGSRDKTCKSWLRAGKTRPGTLNEGIISVVDLAMIEVHGRPHLVAACEDNSLRFFLLDEAGKFSHATHRFYDAYAKAKKELQDNDAPTREKAVKNLGTYADRKSIKLLDQHIRGEGDHAIRAQIVKLIAGLDHPRVPKSLEGLLSHSDKAVRLAALAGLLHQLGETNLRPLELALPHPSVGAVAVQTLAGLANQDEQAMTMLVRSINADLEETRLATIPALETVFPKSSPEANLIALDSKSADVRELAVVRLFERKLLNDPRVKSALRRAGDDADAGVRHTAFHVSLFSSEKLANAVRSRDTGFHRQLWELEQLSVEKKAKAPPKLKVSPLDLAPGDYTPLVQAMASQQLDTSLLGAQALALLGDTRALGLLLQLSRESDPKARTLVCRALASLNDERVVQRLISLLDDDVDEVRDAAYTGLSKVYQKEPLSAAEAGLKSAHSDVRNRGLRSLVDVVKKQKPTTPGTQGWDLLLRALNDSEKAVASEAFKTVINQQIGGGGADSLRFVLSSSRTDIRREVLTEIMGQIKEPWAWDLLLEMFEDPDSELRKEAFLFALKHTKSKDPEPMAVGLKSQYTDLRQLAITKLARLSTKKAQEIIATATSDEDKETRQKALKHLISAGAKDAVRAAMQSPHFDTRLTAAKALAAVGDADSYQPLLECASEPEPDDEDFLETWKNRVADAIAGLEELGDPRAKDLIFQLVLNNEHVIRRPAAKALVMVCSAEDKDRLESLLRDEDPHVKVRAALALVVHETGSSGAPPVLSGNEPGEVLSPLEQIGAEIAMKGPEGILPFLDHDKLEVTQVASSLIDLYESVSYESEPKLAISGLASIHPWVRFSSAKMVEAFASEEAIDARLLDRFNSVEGWNLTLESLNKVAAWLSVNSTERIRLLKFLPLLNEEKPNKWKLVWQAFQDRFGSPPEIQGEPKSRPNLAELQDLIFGTFVGIARDASEYEAIRLLSIRNLISLGKRDAASSAIVGQTLAPFLSDSQVEIRKLSFEGLLELNTDPTLLAGDCIESGQVDMGVEGLKLLSAGSAAETKKILEEVALTRDDYLSIKAAELLAKQTDELSAGMALLDAKFYAMRSTALKWIIVEANRGNQDAQKALHGALNSKYIETRKGAATILATLKDPVAYEALFTLLDNNIDVIPQNQLTRALQKLGDPRTPGDLLDRLIQDQSGKFDESLFFDTIGSFRQTDVVDRLLSLMEDKKRCEAASDTVYKISGHDQDPPWDWERESTDYSWMEKQHPRHDEVLAALMTKCAEINHWPYGVIEEGATLSLSKAVDPILATLACSTDDTLRDEALQSIAWRLRFRDGSPDPLLNALGHKNPDTKFIAAEGLARAGRGDGMSVLLAAIELMDDVGIRIEAVEALGELGDINAVDVLLKLASDDEHALQEAAVEAIGHMGKSDRAEEIFDILKRMVNSTEGIAEKAIRGLRWFDSREGWELVRQRAQLPGYDRYTSTCAAIEMLGYNDDPATRDVILKLFKTFDDADEVMTSARRLFGEDSLEPDLAFAKSGNLYYDEKVTKRIKEKATPGQIFDILPHIEDIDLQNNFVSVLMDSETLPDAEAAEALKSDTAIVASVAAQIIGRSKLPGDVVKESIEQWNAKWVELARKPVGPYDYQANTKRNEARSCVESLIWAAGQLGSEESLLNIIANLPDVEGNAEIKKAAIKALAEGIGSDAALAAIQDATTDSLAEVRELATAALVQLAPVHADAIGEALISDRVSFRKAALKPGKKLKTVINNNVEHPHYQAIVLPNVIEEKDQTLLVNAAVNAGLNDNNRLGAIEALAAMNSEAAENELAKLGKTESIDEELRKAAWRGLRRSKRAREKQAKREEAQA